MGFEWWSSEQRVRINLSETASVVISDDMYQFKIANRSTFMNIVFKNFYPIAKASITLYLDYKKKQLMDITKSNPALSSAQDAVINQLLLQEQKDYKDYIQFQAKNKYISHIYRINTENLKYLQSEECKESEPYNQKLGIYLKCILEEYSTLSYMKRERIFFKERYDMVLHAIETNSLLKITTGNHKQFYVWPFSLEPDTLSTRLYLTGLAKDAKNEILEKHPASFRIPNLNDIKILHQSGRLTKEDTSLMRETILKRKVQFLLDNEEDIHIRLTNRGIYKYNSQVYMRPAFDPDKTKGNVYVFHCTQRQAEYYFFKFGEDAEILSPARLRKRFKTLYKNAILIYNE